MWQAKPGRLVIVGNVEVETTVVLRGEVVADSYRKVPISTPDERGLLDAVSLTLSDASEEASEAYVLMSDRWLRWVVLPWDDALVDNITLQRQCQLQFAAAWGAEALDAKFVVDEAPFGKPRLVVGVERSLWGGLAAVFQAQKLRINVLRPLSVSAWIEHSTKNHAAEWILESREAGHVVHMLVKAGRLCSISSHAVSTSRTSVESLLNRTRLRDPAWPAEAPVVTLDWTETTSDDLISATAIRSTSAPGGPLDLHIPKSKPGMLQLVGAVVAIGLVTLMSLLVMARSREVATLERAVAVQRSVLPTFSASTPSKDDEARLREANGTIRKLNVPIVGLLRAVQPPSDIRVFILGFDLTDVSQDQPTLRISAEAKSAAEMAAYVGNLGEKFPIKHAYLTHHEIINDSGANTYRFAVEAAW